MYAAYALRGRAAALLAVYVAFDPVGAQNEDIPTLYKSAHAICHERVSDPATDWDWLEANPPKIPAVAPGLEGAEAYLAEIGNAITRAERSGLAADDVADLRELVRIVGTEI